MAAWSPERASSTKRDSDSVSLALAPCIGRRRAAIPTGLEHPLLPARIESGRQITLRHDPGGQGSSGQLRALVVLAEVGDLESIEQCLQLSADRLH